MSKVLVAYSTNSDSTGEVADAIASALNEIGHAAVVQSVGEVQTLDDYDAVVLGAPMIFGWHSAMRKFLRRHQAVLVEKKTAFFACAMRLTQAPRETLPSIPLYLDANLVSAPANPGSLNIKERFTTIGHYLSPMLKAAPQVKPLNVGFFYGKLEMYRLKWWQAAFIMAVVQAAPGDYRNWDAIKAWGRSIGELF